MAKDEKMADDGNMKPNRLELGELFKSRSQWVVPIYQRPYVWKSSDDNQIQGMWDDWLLHTEKLLNEKPSNKETIHPHYFGAIIFSYNKKNKLGEIDKMDLVDGQQRLTTFQIALAALRDTADILKYKKIEGIKSYIRNKSDDKNRPIEEEDAYKICPSEHDRDVFHTIVSPNKNRPPESSELTKAYKYFCTEIKKFVDGGKDAVDVVDAVDIEIRIDALKETLLKTFQVVTIQLGDYDDAQQIFASLNGQAEPLSPFDLIRNDIFYRARGHDRKIPIDFKDKWSYFQDSFWSDRVGQALLKKARADHFIIDAVIAQVAREVKKNRIATAYKNYVKETHLDDFEQLDVLINYGKTYRAMAGAMAKNPIDAVTNRIAQMLNLWGISTMNPLILWIDTRPQLSDKEKEELFLMIESYIVRREICNLNSKHFNKTVPAILANMHKQKDNIVGVLKDFLETEKTDSKKMPTDEEVLRDCKNLPFYKNLSAKKRIYILKYIEGAVGDSRFRENTEKNKISVEHIMPQGWKEHWLLKTAKGHVKVPPEPDTDIILDTAEQELMAEQELVAERENLIHTIGNLTLVTRPFNSRLSNKPWGEKKDDLRMMSDLKMNVAIAEKTEWNEDTIKTRSADLAGYINKIWQHPSNY